MSTPVPADASSPRSAPADPARAPLSGSRRLGLLLILLILPVTAVTLPAILVTFFFGQRPHSAPAPPAAPPPDVSGLRNALEQNAQGVLPQPSALADEPIVLTVRAEHIAARAARVSAVVQQYGGSVSEGLPQEGEKDLYVDVPLTASAALRHALTASAGAKNSAPPAPATNPSPQASPAAAAAVDHLEVIIRTAADDE